MSDESYVPLPEELDLLLVISRRAARYLEQHGSELNRRNNHEEKIFARLCLEIFCSLGRFVPADEFHRLLQRVDQLQPGEERLAEVYSILYRLFDRHQEFAAFSLIILHKWVVVSDELDLLPLERELELYIETFAALSTNPTEE